MFCKKCGFEQKNGQKYCPKCGTSFMIERGKEITNEYKETPQPNSPSNSKTNTNKILWAVLLILGIVSCALFAWYYFRPFATDIFNNNEEISDIEAIPFKSTEKGKWGMIKPDGTILFEEEFKDAPTVVREGRFMVRNGNRLWEIYTATDKPERVGDEYVSIGDFYDGVAPAVRRNERISLIDKDGNVITVLEKSGSKEITKIHNFHYGYALFETEDSTVGIVNTRGEILVPARKYCSLYHVAPNRFLALDLKYKDDNDSRSYVYRVIDARDNEVGTIKMNKYNKITVLNDGYIGIEQTSDGESLYGIMDLDGNVIMKPTSKIRGIMGIRDGNIIFSNGDALGVRTLKDEVLIRAKYDAIFWATKKLLWACSIEDERVEWSLIDLEGNKITKDTYQSVLPFYNGKNAFIQITDNTWGIVNNKGEELKGVPDIYIVSPMTADEVIESDYVDLDAVVSAVNITPNGFGGFGINKSPVELLKVFNEFCKEDERIQIDPNTVSGDQLTYERIIVEGITFSAKVYYSRYMTEQGESYYDSSVEEWITSPKTWTKDKPQYVRMSVTGPKMIGRTKMLYKKLASKAKTFGKVYKENENACIITISKDRGLVLVNTGTEIWGIVKGDDTFREEQIEQYSKLQESEFSQGYIEKPLDDMVVDTFPVTDDY